MVVSSYANLPPPSLPAKQRFPAPVQTRSSVPAPPAYEERSMVGEQQQRQNPSPPSSRTEQTPVCCGDDSRAAPRRVHALLPTYL